MADLQRAQAPTPQGHVDQAFSELMRSLLLSLPPHTTQMGSQLPDQAIMQGLTDSRDLGELLNPTMKPTMGR